jgi:hypothetical protein
LYAPFGYLRENPKEYFAAVDYCLDERLSRSDSSFCLKGLGITMMSKFQGQNLEGSEVYVTGLDAEMKYSFYQGVLGYAQLSGKTESELAGTCSRFQTDASLCYAVHQSMKPTFSAYASLNAARDARRDSRALGLAQEYFTHANERDLNALETMIDDSTTYSSQDGVYLGANQIMEMQRNFFGGHESVYWDVTKSEEIRPGVALIDFKFYGTDDNGQPVEDSGSAYIIVHDDIVQHIEIR